MTSAEFGELNDPLERLERNERQGSQAFRFVLLSVLAIGAGRRDRADTRRRRGRVR